ncbi:hypothetical protein IFM89_030109 [Coptis chinensis]|uniref:Clathrin heavy chain linker core motif domain-containing protein n=1 Tax=Coptis chinensis TaxID=261450 RepID=A0A835LXL7_9MAGN|nr:hypothetical protein IFM89_030109 [Coptis chinensis]
MATSNAPITIREVLKLPSIGINPLSINFTDVKMESDKYICVRETASVVIIDMNIPYLPLRMSITADSAMMNPNSRILAFKNQLPGTTCDYLKIFDIEMDTEMRSHQMPKQSSSFTLLFCMLRLYFGSGLLQKCWALSHKPQYIIGQFKASDSQPVKMFDRTANLTNNQIVSYRCDPAEKWLVLIGIAPGTPERPQLIRGNMQLFSVDQQRSQALEAHSASFASFKVSGNENPSTLVCFASKTNYAGQITSKLYVIELGPEPGKQAFTKKQADLFFPPDFIDDFPVAMQISHKYGLIYVITKLGLLFVYDLETVAVVYRFRISKDPIFLTLEVSSIGGFYAVNRRGQLLLVTVNEATIVPFVSGELNNRELAVNIARRGNLPEAENLARITIEKSFYLFMKSICQWFQELFSQAKYKEAAELAVESPQGILRTPDTLKKFQRKLDAFESLELSRLVVNQNKNSLLKNWLAEDKLECSEELSNLVKPAWGKLYEESRGVNPRRFWFKKTFRELSR